MENKIIDETADYSADSEENCAESSSEQTSIDEAHENDSDSVNEEETKPPCEAEDKVGDNESVAPNDYVEDKTTEEVVENLSHVGSEDNEDHSNDILDEIDNVSTSGSFAIENEINNKVGHEVDVTVASVDNGQICVKNVEDSLLVSQPKEKLVEENVDNSSIPNSLPENHHQEKLTEENVDNSTIPNSDNDTEAVEKTTANTVIEKTTAIVTTSDSLVISSDSEEDEAPSRNTLMETKNKTPEKGVDKSHTGENENATMLSDKKEDKAIAQEKEAQAQTAVKDSPPENVSKLSEDASKDKLPLPCAVEKKTNAPVNSYPMVDFSLICVHMDTFRVSNSSTVHLTQLGATSALNVNNEKEAFFQPMKPDDLDSWLDNYKMEGDLLRALHFTREEEGKYEFRAQFQEFKKEQDRLFCVSETEGLIRLMEYLKQFKNIVLLAVDEEDVNILMDKIGRLDSKDADVDIVGFSTWSKVLDFCCKILPGKKYQRGCDLEDFYSKYCGKVTGYIRALDVANFLRKSVKKLCLDYFKQFKLRKVSSKNQFIHEFSKSISLLRKLKGNNNSSSNSLAVEVYSSFRPSVSTRIGIEQMDTITLTSSEDDSDDEPIVKKKKKNLKEPKSTSTEDSGEITVSDYEDSDPDSTEDRTKKRKRRSSKQTSAKKSKSSEPSIVISSDSSDDDNVTLEEDDGGSVGSTPFSARLCCTICLLQLSSVRKLTEHNLTTHPTCHLCSEVFDGYQKLVGHKKAEHVQCSSCPMELVDIDEYAHHMAVFHFATADSMMSEGGWVQEASLPSGWRVRTKPGMMEQVEYMSPAGNMFNSRIDVLCFLNNIDWGSNFLAR